MTSAVADLRASRAYHAVTTPSSLDKSSRSVQPPSVFDGEPLSPAHAKRIIRTSLGAGGVVIFTKHARVELANDHMTEQDALNVLRGGIVTHDGYQGNSHRYQVNTSRFCVVVAFDSQTETIVITAWRRS